jgi:hypothetical protein
MFLEIILLPLCLSYADGHVSDTETVSQPHFVFLTKAHRTITEVLNGKTLSFISSLVQINKARIISI